MLIVDAPDGGSHFFGSNDLRACCRYARDMVGTVGAEYALKLDQGEPVAESLQRLTYGVGEKGALMGFVMTCQPFN